MENRGSSSIPSGQAVTARSGADRIAANLYLITAASRRVVYVADQQADELIELFSSRLSEGSKGEEP